MNIFKKILSDMPPPKNEIIPDRLEDKEVADQLTKLLNYELLQKRKRNLGKYGRRRNK